MEMDFDDMFGERRPLSDSDPGSDDDDGGVNNPDDEAIEVPAPGENKPAEAQPVKPKRVIKNPQPKLDIHRLGGPRGIPVLQKSFQGVKFKGKGHEKEDLDVVLKTLEHWAFRLYPKLPFRNTLEQIEKLGFKKNVQVLMNRLRLDMFTESELNGEGERDVRRGVDNDEQAVDEPTTDIFDELLGHTGFTSSQPQVASTPAAKLTDEQKERLERNKRKAEEKRQERIRREKEEERLMQEEEEERRRQEEEERMMQEEEDAFTSQDMRSADPVNKSNNFNDLIANSQVDNSNSTQIANSNSTQIANSNDSEEMDVDDMEEPSQRDENNEGDEKQNNKNEKVEEIIDNEEEGKDKKTEDTKGKTDEETEDKEENDKDEEEEKVDKEKTDEGGENVQSVDDILNMLED